MDAADTATEGQCMEFEQRESAATAMESLWRERRHPDIRRARFPGFLLSQRVRATRSGVARLQAGSLDFT